MTNTIILLYYGDPADINEEDYDWFEKYKDVKYPCHYIGIFSGTFEEKIRTNAAMKAGVHPDTITLIDISKLNILEECEQYGSIQIEESRKVCSVNKRNNG